MPRTNAPTSTDRSLRTAGGVVLAVGAWLVVAWLVLGYMDLGYAAADNIIIGVLLAGLGFVAVRDPEPARAVWTASAILGVLLVLSPFAFRFGPVGARAVAPYANTVLCGVLVFLVSAWASRRTRTRLSDH